jgi:hypothetical protein
MLKSENFVLDRSAIFQPTRAAEDGLATGSSPAGLANVVRAFDALSFALL